MSRQPNPTPEIIQPEPRWPSVVVILAIAGLYFSLPGRLTVGPSWLMPILILAALIAVMVSHRTGRAELNISLGIALLILITLALAWSLGALIAGLPGKRQPPADLLRSAAALWSSNVLVFASWYWRLDAGGPHRRDLRSFHTDGAFLFPQMTLTGELSPVKKRWRPGFVDYLFLAFNASTAFSPTDVPVLSRWAKLLMMIQSSVSLGTVVIVGARAVNIL
jgi:hypothetical protein